MKYFKLPDLAEGLTDATVIEWFVKEGDEVLVDQLLLSVETAKAIVEIPSPYSGKILKIAAQNGETVFVGEPLIGFDLEDDDANTVVGNLSNIESEPTEDLTEKINVEASQQKGDRIQIGIMKLKQELGLSQENKPPITAAKKSTSAKLSGNLDNTRQLMAVNMAKSHTEVVPVTVFDEADITQWSKNTDITVALIQAICTGIKAVPIMNSHYDSNTQNLSQQTNVNMGIAVDSSHGLYVPVISNAETKNASELRDDLNELKSKVGSKTIQPSEMANANFTLSNFGMFAGQFATPIVIPPMVAILGLGKLSEKPAIINQAIQPRRVLPLSLTFDHRIITGGEATRFLAEIIKHLESLSP